MVSGALGPRERAAKKYRSDWQSAPQTATRAVSSGKASTEVVVIADDTEIEPEQPFVNPLAKVSKPWETGQVLDVKYGSGTRKGQVRRIKIIKYLPLVAGDFVA